MIDDTRARVPDDLGDHSALRRLRDFTGGIPRPSLPKYPQLLRDDGHLDYDEQIRILEILLPDQNRRSVVRFTIMLVLSVTIATMGLAANSGAVVIGAMLIAPLMNPIMTFAAAVGLGLGRRAGQAAFLVIAGALLAIALGALLAAILPDLALGSEILARTRPDVRDLIVAIAAGTAGAYATARSDASAALPGVAIAVALVPPLAATGILIQAREGVLAEGAALLFLTNLLAIIVSALAVMLATGVVPTIRLCLQSRRIAMTTVGIVLATAAISIPLTTRSLDAATSSKQQEHVTAIVQQWLGTADLDLAELDLSGNQVTVEVTGLDEPPPAFELATLLTPVLGADAEAVVRWDQRAQGVARADSPPVDDPEDVARSVVESWVAGLLADGLSFEVLDVSVIGDVVDIEVSGPVAPPASAALPDDIAHALGRSVDVRVRWIQSFDPGLGGEPPAQRLDRIVAAWIGPRSSVRLVAASISGDTATVDLGADGQPLGLQRLSQLLVEHIDGVVRVEVRLLPLTVVSPVADTLPVPAIG